VPTWVTPVMVGSSAQGAEGGAGTCAWRVSGCRFMVQLHQEQQEEVGAGADGKSRVMQEKMRLTGEEGVQLCTQSAQYDKNNLFMFCQLFLHAP
jgi:hypothetical protein